MFRFQAVARAFGTPIVNRVGALAGACIFVGIGCTDPAEPFDRSVRTNKGVQASATSSFYYYQGKRIPLEADPNYVVVKWTDTQDRSAFAEASGALERSLGVSIQERTPLANRPGFEIVTLASGAGANATVVAGQEFRQASGVDFASPVYHTADGADLVPLDRVLVEFRPGVTNDQIETINKQLGTRTVRRVNPDSAWFFHILEFPRPLSREPFDLVAELYEHDLVKWADIEHLTDYRRANTPAVAGAQPTDPFWINNEQYYMNNDKGIKRNGVYVDIRVQPAWEVTKGGGIPSAGGMRVAVIDDGVDYSHPDLNVSPLGYDAVQGKTFPCTDCQFSPREDPGHPEASDSHGTMVAGIINAQHNGVGSVGIAPKANVIPIRIFRGERDPSTAEIAEAIDFAWHLADVHVINGSWGSRLGNDAVKNAIRRAARDGRGGLGTVMAFSAGNTSNRAEGIVGHVRFPANQTHEIPAVISVGAINRSGLATNYTPRATHSDRITVVAPSAHFTRLCAGDVVTTDLTGAAGCSDGPGGTENYVSSFSGTSAAAPQVAGAVLLLLSERPNLTAVDVNRAIKAAADDWGDRRVFGEGKLNLQWLINP